MSRTALPHGFVTRSVHWLSAALIAYGYAKGLDNVSQLADPGLLRSEVLFALILGALFLVRLIWTRFVGGATRLPEDAPAWERRASAFIHTGLYASVFAIVLTGLGIALAYSWAPLGGLALTAVIALHEAALALLPILLGVHIAGALWHGLIRRDGVLAAMTGRWRLPRRLPLTRTGPPV